MCIQTYKLWAAPCVNMDLLLHRRGCSLFIYSSLSSDNQAESISYLLHKHVKRKPRRRVHGCPGNLYVQVSPRVRQRTPRTTEPDAASSDCECVCVFTLIHVCEQVNVTCIRTSSFTIRLISLLGGIGSCVNHRTGQATVHKQTLTRFILQCVSWLPLFPP